ncbi:MAG: DUF1592 domain-containing protein [Polyangiales bacterium]
MSKRAYSTLILLLAGCQGTIGDAPSAEPGATPPVDLSEECDPSVAPDAELLRIDRRAYDLALRSLFGDESVDAVGSAVTGVPNTQSGQYRSEVEVPSFDVVQSYVDVASSMAFYLTDDPSRLRVLSECLSELSEPLNETDEACLFGFIDDFGLRLTRRPLSAEDHARFVEAYEIGSGENASTGVATLLMSMLLDPRFLYHFEVDGEEREPGVITLTSYEVAARLARVLWKSIPDDSLLAAAEEGFEGPEGEARLREQIERMWSTPEAREGFRGFISEWIALRHEGPATDALLEFATNMVYERDGTLAELFLDRTAFIEDAELAEVYGLPADTRGEVQLGEEHRAGLLTRAGWLETSAIEDTNAGHIIHRGKALSDLLCVPIPLPDDDVFPDDDPADPTEGLRTIRQRFTDVTSEQPCSSCHVRLDALGAPFGHFDFDGAYIDDERITVDEEEHILSIDSSSSVNVGEGTLVDVESAIDISVAAAQSEGVAACLGAELTENMMGREVAPSDACLIQAAQDLLSPSRSVSVREALFAIVTSPSFSVRSIPEAQ